MIFEVTALTKYFGGLAAVSGVDITADEGEIVGLIGPNGAGRSIADGSPEEIRNNREVIQAYPGGAHDFSVKDLLEGSIDLFRDSGIVEKAYLGGRVTPHRDKREQP